jgi:hypothetical protein
MDQSVKEMMWEIRQTPATVTKDKIIKAKPRNNDLYIE